MKPLHITTMTVPLRLESPHGEAVMFGYFSLTSESCQLNEWFFQISTEGSSEEESAEALPLI